MLAHAAVGGVLAGAAAPRGCAGRVAAAAALCAALPDADVLAFALGIPYAHPLGHRGISHGLPFAAALGLAAAPLVTPDATWRAGRRLAAAAILVLATASHGLLDMATDAGRGVGLLIPFDARRFFWPWRPIPTSPIGLEDFLRGDALGILAFEAVALVTPAALGAALLRRLRAPSPRRAGPRPRPPGPARR
ncbi:MAG: metal-dependent hydrolase [Myxococcota bacterium]|nr:metal-dependent hydrolase [Myxococcota bacterium]